MTPGVSSRTMKLGLIPSIDEGTVNGETPRFREVKAVAQAAEQVGFDSLWLADHLIFRFPGKDEQGCWELFTFLSALAAVTTRIQRIPQTARSLPEGGTRPNHH